MELWRALDLDMERHRLIALVGGGGKTTSIYALAHQARIQGKTVVISTSTHIMPHPRIVLTGSTEKAELGPLLKEHGIVLVGTMAREGKMVGAGDLGHCKAVADIVLVEADGARMQPLKVPGDHEPVLPDQADAVIALCGMDSLGQPIGTVCHRPERVTQLLDKQPEETITPQDVAKILLSPEGSRKNVGDKPYRVILNKADSLKRRAGAAEIAALLAQAGVTAAITEYKEEERGGLCWF